MVSTRRSASAGASGTPSLGGGGGSSMARQASTDIPRIPLLGVVPGVEAFDAAIDRRSDYYRLQALSHHHAPPQAPLLNVPNVLTFLRLVAVPILVSLWFSPLKSGPFACALLFVGASFTDWLDGYIARRFEIVTTFGAFLDPVADKIMVTAALVLLTLSPPPPLSAEAISIPVMAITCREITMSALREWAAAAGGGAHKAVKVNALGKWKTALQMAAMSLLLFARDTTLVPHVWKAVHVSQANVVSASFALLWAAAGLAIWSLAAYFKNVWTHFVSPVAAGTPRKAA